MTDAECAAQRAARIVETNEERKERTRSMTKQAAEEVQKQPLPPVLVVYLQECHESVAGIVAGNLREQFYRPVYVITDSGDHLKGSGRSIPGYHMQQELQACQKYLTEFGGHAAAAGFSLRREQLEGLKSALLAHCSLTQEQLIEKVTYDREVALAEMDTTLVTQLSWWNRPESKMRLQCLQNVMHRLPRSECVERICILHRCVLWKMEKYIRQWILAGKNALEMRCVIVMVNRCGNG